VPHKSDKVATVLGKRKVRHFSNDQEEEKHIPEQYEESKIVKHPLESDQSRLQKVQEQHNLFD
jgi:hypothetical protein